uniref:Macaca fascicularis brain cDNA clone: QorA-10273, similar to human hypothetical protein FLJ11588 (FLJ11588), mRNA, RefSeq: NM_024603.1 n=1 Tax=Macaca fascicularis TaxID=9541 RepID=I7G309_MACFA|nr:unnamed protein product [Macaca fascicularis]
MLWCPGLCMRSCCAITSSSRKRCATSSRSWSGLAGSWYNRPRSSRSTGHLCLK